MIRSTWVAKSLAIVAKYWSLKSIDSKSGVADLRDGAGAISSWVVDLRDLKDGYWVNGRTAWLLAVDCILERFSGFEFWRFRSLNLQFCARSGIAPDPCSAFRNWKSTETNQSNSTAIFKLLTKCGIAWKWPLVNLSLQPCWGYPRRGWGERLGIALFMVLKLEEEEERNYWSKYAKSFNVLRPDWKK